MQVVGTEAPGRGRGKRQRTNSRVMLASLACAILIFLGVVTGATDALDTMLFRQAHGLDSNTPQVMPQWLLEAVRDVTALGSMIILAFAVVFAAAYLVTLQRYRLAALLTASALLATLVSTMLKLSMDRVRPSLIEPMVVTYTASFPSGHALLSAAIILPMAALLARTVRAQAARRLIVLSALLLTLLVGASRVYLGVHWPTDVLAGWCFGIFWAGATLHAAESLK